MTRKKLFITIGILFFASGTFVAADSGQQKDWADVKSCIDLTKQLKNLIQTPNIQDKPFAISTPFPSLVDQGNSSVSSQTFFTSYDEASHLLTLIKGPKDPTSTLIDLSKAKKIAKLKLPNDFKEVSVQFFAEKVMILSAVRQISAQESETIILFYQIANDRIDPLHFFKQSGRLAKLQLQNEKLYSITTAPFLLETAKKLIQKRGDAPELFPQFTEGVSYSVPTTTKKTISCQDFKYLFVGDQMPSLRTIVVVDLNRITQDKEQLTLLGSFDHFQFSKDFLYATSENKGDTLIQRFGLEPKVNYQKSELLSGKFLQGGAIVQGTRSSFITERSSGKFNVYTITPFDARFMPQESLTLFSGKERYLSAETLGDFLILTRGEEQGIIVAKGVGTLSISPFPSLLLPEKSQLFLFAGEPLSLLAFKEEQERIVFSLFKLETPPGALQKQRTASYAGTSKLLGKPLRNQDVQLLFLPIRIEDQGKRFQGIKGLQIGKRETLQELFSRYYPEVPFSFRSLGILPHFSYVITPQLIDMFLPTNPQKMSVLSGK